MSNWFFKFCVEFVDDNNGIHTLAKEKGLVAAETYSSAVHLISVMYGEDYINNISIEAFSEFEDILILNDDTISEINVFVNKKEGI